MAHRPNSQAALTIEQFWKLDTDPKVSPKEVRKQSDEMKKLMEAAKKSFQNAPKFTG